MDNRLKKIWREWRGFFVFVAVMLVFRSAIADWNQVPSGSMKPSILAGDRIVVDKLAYDLRVPFTLTRITRWSEPRRGDIVTFPSPKDERLFVKRIVGIPGDQVEMRRNQLVINGEHAIYTPLSREEVRELPMAYTLAHRFYRESILGNERVVMVDSPRKPSYTGYTSFARVTVPEGNYLVLGDNRDNSGDFRVIGFVARERILGRAHAIAFSLDYEKYYAPRLDRFFTDLP